MPHRNRSLLPAHGAVMFVTTTVMNFQRIFALGDRYYLILIRSLEFLIAEHSARLYAYVLMPSHLHLILYLPRGAEISAFMRDFKKYTSVIIRQKLEEEGREELLEMLRRNAVGAKSQVFKLWMDGFDDLVIINEDTLRTKIEYLHQNPVRAGLVEHAEDWKYSSARNYTGNDQTVLSVAMDWSISE